MSPKRLWITVTSPSSLLIQKWNWSLRKKFYTECQFLWHRQFLEYEKISVVETFLGVRLSRESAQAEISPLLEERFPPHFVPHLPSSQVLWIRRRWLKVHLRNQITIFSRRKNKLTIYYASLVVDEFMLFLVFLYWRLKILMNRLWLQLFDCCYLIQAYLW